MNIRFCVLGSCPELTSPENGNVDYQTVEGSYASYTCNDGYKLSGLNYRQCISGTWTNSEPTCVIVGEYECCKTLIAVGFCTLMNVFLISGL